MATSESLLISSTKIRIPNFRQGWVSRPRLLEAIHDDLEKQLLLIVAPAGYGKTTLLVDMACNSEIPVCWLSLDTLDREPQRFLIYLISSISERYPAFGRDSFAILKEMKSFEDNGEQILITLANEITEKISEHFVLIMDDYHLVGETLIIRQLLARLLQLVSENFHLILASRNLPDFPDMPRLIVQNLVGGLSYEELAFNPDEVEQLFFHDSPSERSSENALELVRETEGWIAAIQLSGGKPGKLSNIDPLRSTRELFDYFAKEVLSRQTKNIQRFLLLTSFFDNFDVSLCEEVLVPLLDGEELMWSSLFETVQAKNLYSVLVDESGEWMRYHHLFQHFLKSKLRYDEPVLAWHIQQSLAQAYEKREAWEDALQIYHNLDDLENFIRLLSYVGSIFIRSRRIITMASWLERLPLETICSKPELLSLQGVVYATSGDVSKAIDFFNLAEEKQRGHQDQNQLAFTLMRRAEAYRRLGQYSVALKDVDEVIEFTRGSQKSNLKNIYAEALRVKGLLYFGRGELKDALSWLKDSLQISRSSGFITSLPILETELGVVYRRLGQPDIAARYYASALRAWGDAGNTEWKARLLNNLGLLYHMTGRLEEALPLLEESLQIAEKSGYQWLQANELISLGDLWTDLGDLESAHRYYDQAMTLATQQGSSLLIFYANLGDARLKQMKGEFLKALYEYNQIETGQVKLGLYEQALLNIERGICLLKLGELNRSVDALQLAVDMFDQEQKEMEQASARLWLAAAWYERDSEGATEMIKAFLPLPRTWDKATPLMINAARVGRWLRERNILPLGDPLLADFFSNAERITQELALLRKKQLKSVSKTLEPIQYEFFTFGTMRALKDGYELRSSDWQTREAKELFFFLLQAPPMTKEEIGLVFWPDITPARLKMRFKINIYRIRQALGQDVIVFDGEKYRFNKAIHYTWDREVFDSLLKDARDASMRLHILPDVMALVKGPYMEDSDLDWAVLDRLQYNEKIQQTMVDMADAYLTNGQLEECIQVARQILTFDLFVEDGHRILLLAYAAQHDQAKVVRYFQKYEKMLDDELGIQPSVEFLALYDEVMQKF